MCFVGLTEQTVLAPNTQTVHMQRWSQHQSVPYPSTSATWPQDWRRLVLGWRRTGTHGCPIGVSVLLYHRNESWVLDPPCESESMSKIGAQPNADLCFILLGNLNHLFEWMDLLERMLRGHLSKCQRRCWTFLQTPAPVHGECCVLMFNKRHTWAITKISRWQTVHVKKWRWGWKRFALCNGWRVSGRTPC